MMLQVSWPPVLLARSTRPGWIPASSASPLVSGLCLDSHGRARPEAPISPAEVPISATAHTRSRNSRGCRSASAMIAMPPIECPTSTTGPRLAVARSTASRSLPSCSIVLRFFDERPERPWLRWSYCTSRTLGSVSFGRSRRWKCQQRASSV